MTRFLAAIGAALCLGSTVPAHAGWIVEYSNVAVSSRGTRQPAITTTSRYADQKIRSDQDKLVMINDLKADTYTMLNTERKFFWTGTSAEYESQMASRKLENLGKHFKSLKDKTEMDPIDPEQLPRIVIRKTDLQQDIAGYRATKYVIESNGELFQELWLTDDIDMSADVSTEKQIALQRRASRNMVGKSAGPNNALYANEEYRKLLEKRFIVRSVVYHGAGQFERTVTAVRQTDIAPEEFQPPKDYKRVRLSDFQAARTESAGTESAEEKGNASDR